MENRNGLDVIRHFDVMVDIFDSIYEGEQDSFLYRVVDALFRKNILDRRLKIILNLCGDVGGKDILDLGCGPGRYTALLAKRGPKSVLAVDISIKMVELAKRLAESNGLSDICRFETVDFLRKEFNNKFNIIIAAGLFDYTQDPRPFLLKIKGLLKEKAFFSFPVKWNIFTPVRAAWLKKRKCPSYYYSKGEILRLAKDCGLKVDLIQKIGSFLVPGNYIVVCRPD